jgi:flagellar biogenesis protein FliO
MWQQLLQIFLSFAAVIGLMLALSYLVRRFGLQQKWQVRQSNNGSIQVLDNMFLDPKKRIVVLQFEKAKYMLLLDGERTQLIDKIENIDATN